MMRFFRIILTGALVGAVLYHAAGALIAALTEADLVFPAVVLVGLPLTAMLLVAMGMPRQLWFARGVTGTFLYAAAALATYWTGQQLIIHWVALPWYELSVRWIPFTERIMHVLGRDPNIIWMLPATIGAPPLSYYLLLHAWILLKSLRTFRPVAVPSFVCPTTRLAAASEQDATQWGRTFGAFALGGVAGAASNHEWLIGDADDAVASNGSTTFDLGINPASGLPMIADSMMDVGGNVYGSDSSHDLFDSWSTSFDEPMGGLIDDGIGCGLDDSFGCNSDW